MIKRYECRIDYTVLAESAQEATDLMRAYQFEQMFEAPNVHEFVHLIHEVPNEQAAT